MTKNRIGLSNETIWKSRWTHAFSNFKNTDKFVLKNGYPTKQPVHSVPPSYREYSDLHENYQSNKPKKAFKSHHDDREPLTTEKTWKDVGPCLKCTNVVIGIFITLSLILSIIGTTTPYWFDTGSVHIGLFQTCTKSSACEPISTFTSTASESTPTTWLIATILNLCGCSILFLSIVFYVVYVHCTSVDYRKASCGVLLSIIVFLGAAAMLGGMAVMLIYYLDNVSIYQLNWSYFVAASGGGLAFITFNIIVVFVCVLAFQ